MQQEANGAATAAKPGGAPAVTLETLSGEDRLLSALCYPLWPIAFLLLLLQSRRSGFLRFNVMQSLAVNALGLVFYVACVAASGLPIIGWQSALVVPFLMPAWFVADLYLAVRAYAGYTTRVPIASEYASKHG